MATDKFITLTQQRLKQILHYDPKTGCFTRTLALSNEKCGGIAGCVDHKGYIRIRVNGRRYRAHRLAFLYMNGKWPKDQTDHINRIRSDNRFSNLREATQSENKQNSALHSNNTSGFKGVRLHSQKKMWRATIYLDGREYHLGFFRDPIEAAIAYDDKAKKLFGSFARLNFAS